MFNSSIQAFLIGQAFQMYLQGGAIYVCVSCGKSVILLGKNLAKEKSKDYTRAF